VLSLLKRVGKPRDRPAEPAVLPWTGEGGVALRGADPRISRAHCGERCWGAAAPPQLGRINIGRLRCRWRGILSF